VPELPPSALWKIPAFLTNVATDTPHVDRSVQLRCAGKSL